MRIDQVRIDSNGNTGENFAQMGIVSIPKYLKINKLLLIGLDMIGLEVIGLKMIGLEMIRLEMIGIEMIAG